MDARPAVVGRDRERELIRQSLGRAEAGARVLLLEGEAGIGKTILLRTALDDARDRGWLVLQSAPASGDAQLSLSALRDLLDPVFDDVAQALPWPQRRALAVALLREEPDRPPVADAIAVGSLSAIRALATRAPLVIAIDDLQWLDAASAAVLSYALRRVGRERVAFVLARRSDSTSMLPLDLDRVERERVDGVRVEGLTSGALARIIGERLGAAYPRSTLRRLHEVAGGNPFFALELARALGDRAAPLRAGEPLPVPESLQELVRGRVAALPASARDALAVAAALSRATLAVLEAAIGRDAAVSLAPAIEANIVDVDVEHVRFTHPLFAGAIYDGTPPGRRDAIHRRLAQVVTDPEERARHLALATDAPDAAAAAAVEAGAHAAFQRGGPAAAAALAGEARRLTAGDDETARRRVLIEADYRFAAGDTSAAAGLLQDLVARAASPVERARSLSRLARVRHFERDIVGSVSLLYDALASATGDAAVRAEIEEGLAWGLLLIRRDLAAAADHARSAARIAAERGDDAPLAEALAAQALIELLLGRSWRATMDRALALERATLGLRVLRHPSFAYGYCLTCTDDLDAARAVFEELMRRADEHGDESSPPTLLNHLALVELLAGRWARADEHAAEGSARAAASGQRPTQAAILGRRALVEARRGSLADATASAERSLAIAADGPFDRARPEVALVRGGEMAVWAMGQVELARGDPAAAHAWLGPLCAALLAAGIEEPGEIRALPDEIEALLALGRVDDAERHVERLARWSARVARPSVAALADRCRGLVLAARGQDDAALAALERAVTAHERAPLPYERARTLLALGAQQRRVRERSRARDTLRRAEAEFAALGAATGVGQARAEAGRIGGRRAVGDALTPTERRIAELVASGKRNREVAAALVVSERTVEAALTQIYRKLEVRSRTELARKLARS